MHGSAFKAKVAFEVAKGEKLSRKLRAFTGIYKVRPNLTRLNICYDILGKATLLRP